MASLGIVLLSGWRCSKPSQSEVDEIANREARRRACGSLDLRTVATGLTAAAKESTCWTGPGFRDANIAAVCNGSNPPPAASWVCMKCQAPTCPTDTANCTTCGANLSTQVALNISVNIEGYTVNVRGNVQYAARVNFTNIIARVFADTSVTGDQPAFDYWTATTDVTSGRDASISGSLTASGDFVGSVSVSASFECAVGVNFRGAKSANQPAGSCRACARTGSGLNAALCGIPDAGVFDAGPGFDAGGPGSDGGPGPGSDGGPGPGSDAGGSLDAIVHGGSAL